MDINNKTTIQFSDDFFKEEDRCGYHVSTKLKKIWAIELDLLNELLKVCQKHDIQVCVFAGTILGAVRHHGFIPWDDDIDVALTRDNYDKLVKIAPFEFKNQYFFQTALNDRKFFLGYARLRNSLTTGLIKWNESPDYNNGIYIDVFVLDGIVDDMKKLQSQIKKRDNCEHLLKCYYMGSQSKKALVKMIKRILNKTYCKIVPYEDKVKEYDRIISKYTDATDKIGLMTHPMGFIKKYWCTKEDIINLTWVGFENIQVPIPVNYDAILRNMYGDYMKFPPIDQRGMWHNGILEFDPDTPYLEYLKK